MIFAIGQAAVRSPRVTPITPAVPSKPPPSPSKLPPRRIRGGRCQRPGLAIRPSPGRRQPLDGPLPARGLILANRAVRETVDKDRLLAKACSPPRATNA
ncbi:MAG: hypothetical protein ACLR0N_17845 [Bilophila wadsworthia]